MNAVVSRRGVDVSAELKKLVVDKIVLTFYNNKIYRVAGVNQSLTPESTFVGKEGPTTYIDYYRTHYNLEVTHRRQPLLHCTNRKWECLLVPEFCFFTGLTDEQRSDITLRREMIRVTQKSPKERLRRCSELVGGMKNTEKTQALMRVWGMDVSAEPLPVKARVLPGGTIRLHNYQFALTDCVNFDREVQRAMFSHPPLNKWCVFYPQEEQQCVDNFMATLKQVIDTFRLNCQPPRLFPINGGNRWPAWEAAMRANLDPTVQIAVCVLPGSRGKSPLYDDLKRLNFSQMPLPTQCVLTSTLKKDKGLRSVINKLVTQVVAKIGGCPWAGELPVSNTMVIGIDVFDKKGSDRITAFCCTIDRDLCRYVSFPHIGSYTAGQDPFALVIHTACKAFVAANQHEPDSVIVLRDGVSEGERSRVLESEVKSLRKALDSRPKQPRLMVLVVNKKTSARFFHRKRDDLANPPPGTVVDSEVVSATTHDFYLVPTKGTQGVISPTHFHVVYDDWQTDPDKVELLLYRMSYLYYNWSGSIRVPAACQYAHKLAFAYGERGSPQPNKWWTNSSNLYFL